jgi:hypothetical protein
MAGTICSCHVFCYEGIFVSMIGGKGLAGKAKEGFTPNWLFDIMNLSKQKDMFGREQSLMNR